jgi:threonine dehydrogenase-like Zn-dependent dehydrogenase
LDQGEAGLDDRPGSQETDAGDDLGRQAGRVAPLPDSFVPDRGIFAALAGVALQAIHDAHIKVGDYVVVFGLGVIGLLAVLESAGRPAK